MGIPILDVAWSILRRIFSGQHSYVPDRKHLHFKLLSIGLSQPKAVLLLIFLSLLFGVSSIFLQSQSKVVALGFLFLVMLILVVFLTALDKNRKMN
jgi:UDP-GlcNAc:undecaprenyl-phosphate GlcNAc-1-phosphate transferase